ncbi:MAG: restriction endonuclease subunit S [Bacteroidales bacterium]|nr:restriction endonuclease subunit S [Bacteroidales bacterium]
MNIKDICAKGSSSLKQKDVEGKSGQYPVFGASGLIGHIGTYHQDKEYIAIVKDGSGIGRTAFYPAKSSVIGTMQYILPKEGFNIRYVGYCLQSLDLAKYKQGAAIPHIYFKDYGEREVNVTTDEHEQQKIVDYLDNAFAKIDQLKANAEKQLEDAQSLFSAALEEAMSPKEGWIIGKLGDFINFRRGHDLTHNQMKCGKFPVAGSSGIIGYHNEETPIHPCITIGRSGSVGKIFIYDRCWAHNTTLYVDDYKGNNPYFLKYLIENLHLGEFHGGSAVPTLNRNNLHPIQTAVPCSLPEQQSIVSHLDALSAKVNQLKENYKTILSECDALKQALLREVFE